MSVVGRWWWYIRISVANTRIALWVKTYLLFHIGKKETRKTRNPCSGVGDDGGCWREPKAKSLLKIDSRFSLILSLFSTFFFSFSWSRWWYCSIHAGSFYNSFVCARVPFLLVEKGICVLCVDVLVFSSLFLLFFGSDENLWRMSIQQTGKANRFFSAFQTNLLVGIWDFFTFTFFSHSQYDHLSIFLVLTTMISMFFGGYAFLDDRTNRPYHFHFFHTCLRVYVYMLCGCRVCVCLCLWHVWCTHLMAQSCWWLPDSHNTTKILTL